MADEAYQGGVVENTPLVGENIPPSVIPIRPTEAVEASRWPVAGCIALIGLCTAAILGAWYLIWRIGVRLVDQIIRLT